MNHYLTHRVFQYGLSHAIRASQPTPRPDLNKEDKIWEEKHSHKAKR